MAIPSYQELMLPLLKLAGDKKEHALWQAIDILAKQYNLTDKERHQLLSSGKQAVFTNRVGWARTYMKKAGLIEYPRRGFFCITDRGLNVLQQNLSELNVGLLYKFKEFREFKTSLSGVPVKDSDLTEISRQTPEEVLENAYQNLRDDLSKDLIIQIKSSTPNQFENIVVDLIVKMGYGGSKKDAGEAIGKSGDEGIDGIIKEDILGLDIIYIQAKKWDSNVSRPEIQKFAGALQGKHAKKGIFITTSDFSNEAYNYVSNIDVKIILINGTQLTQLMIDHNIGVSLNSVYETKRIDLDYFTEE
ncbi:restriction endonuclease [Chloroflexota bacterium]